MSIIFGDFVFKISAPVESAIKNMLKWDKTQEQVTKNTEKNAKEEQKLLASRKKSWDSFLGNAKTLFVGLAAAVMRWSPHIQAHLSIMGLHMRLLAMDIGKTWAPAFETASKAFETFSKWYRSLDSEEAGPLANAAREASDIALGLGAAWASWKLIQGAGNLFFGSAASAAALETSALATAGALAPLIASGLGIGIYFLARLGDLDKNTSILLGLIGAGAYLLGGVITIPFTLALVAGAGILDNFNKHKDEEAARLSEIAGQDVKYGTEEALDDLMGRTFGSQDLSREEYLRVEAANKELLELTKKYGVQYTNATMNIGQERLTIVEQWWESELDGFRKFGVNINTENENQWITNKMGVLDSTGKIRSIIDAANAGNVESYANASPKIQKEVKQMYEYLEAIASEEELQQIKNGEDLITNFANGMENKRGFLGRAWDSLMNILSYDNPDNDATANKWGQDFVKHFSSGITQEANVKNNVTSNVTINNQSSGNGMDPYTLANMAGSLVSKQFANLKGLGTQYD